MEALAWWGIPIGATLLAIIWVAVANRPRRPADPHESMEQYARFRAALDAARTGRDRREH